MILYTYVETPLQPLLLTSNGVALTGLYMHNQRHRPDITENWECCDTADPFPETRRQLEAYFQGMLIEFDLPLAPCGTPFQQRVWEELRQIAFGETCSYGDLARKIENPNASRAVGLANGKNPISIIVPCHRVIGTSGKLTGYGGGLSRKETLLAFEAAVRKQGPHALVWDAPQSA